MIKENIIYKTAGTIAFLEFLNCTAGNFIGYFAYELPFYFELFLFTLIAYGLVIFLAWRKVWISLVIFLFYNIYDYWNSYTWGLSGFSIQGQHLQPLLSVWFAMLSIVFCLFGGIYLMVNGKNDPIHKSR